MVVDTITVGSGPFGVAITPNGQFAYVINTGGNVSVINTSSNMVADTISVASGFGIAITPDGLLAYATNFNNNTVSVINITNNSVINIIPIGRDPFGVAFLFAIQPATKGHASQKVAEFLTQICCTNTLTWSPPAFGSTPVTYMIFGNAALTDLIGTVSATGPLVFQVNSKKKHTTYYIVGVDVFGNFSSPLVITT
jgi:YVTN family beta-propeller protein